MNFKTDIRKHFIKCRYKACAFCYSLSQPLEVSSQIPKHRLLWQGAAVYQRLMDSLPGELSVLSQAHSRVSSWPLRDARHKTPSSKTQAALPPAPTAKSTSPVICHSSSCTRLQKGRSLQRSTRGSAAAGCSQTRLEDPRSDVQQQAGGSTAARSAQILLAADENAAWS